jgi:hypothetical protein
MRQGEDEEVDGEKHENRGRHLEEGSQQLYRHERKSQFRDHETQRALRQWIDTGIVWVRWQSLYSLFSSHTMINM